MGTHFHPLRKQVVSELRKRRLIFYTIIFLSFIYLSVSLLFGDMGLLRYQELHETKTHLEAQIQQIEKENKQLKSEIKSLKEDPFFIEKHGREDFGLAKPEEYIFHYDDR